MILLSALVVSFQNNLVLNVVLAGIFLVVVSCYRSWQALLKLLGILTLAAVGVFFSGYFYGTGATAGSAGPLLYGLQLASRIFCFGLLGSSFAATTTLTDFSYSLQQQLRLPSTFAYGLLAAFHIAPLIQIEYQNVRASLAARGVTAVAWSPRLLIPLLVKAVRWSETLAVAMESRGFTEGPRTYARRYTITWRDGLFAGFLCSLVLFFTYYF